MLICRRITCLSHALENKESRSWRGLMGEFRVREASDSPRLKAFCRVASSVRFTAPRCSPASSSVLPVSSMCEHILASPRDA
jgi:hypothetical protein